MPNQFHITEHAQGTYMVEGPASNWIILEDNGVYTVIDGGYPGDVPLVLDSIRRLGLSVKDAAAMLITHGHVDHTGAAAYFASELWVPVLSSHAEHTQMTGEERFQVSPVQNPGPRVAASCVQMDAPCTDCRRHQGNQGP